MGDLVEIKDYLIKKQCNSKIEDLEDILVSLLKIEQLLTRHKKYSMITEFLFDVFELQENVKYFIVREMEIKEKKNDG